MIGTNTRSKVEEAPMTPNTQSVELFAGGVRCSHCKSMCDNADVTACEHCKLVRSDFRSSESIVSLYLS